MQILRWRNVSLLKNSLISPKFTTTHFALFHSTPTSCHKWKTTQKFDIKGSQQPKKDIKGSQLSTKDYIKFTIRQKRADTKKALRTFNYNYGSADISVEGENIRKVGGQTKKSGNSHRKLRPKSSTPHAEKGRQKKTKRKFKNDGFCDDFDEHPEPLFQAVFGNRCYTSSFNSTRDSFSQSSTFEFEWTERLSGKHKSRTWTTISDTESDDESYTVGSCSDRTILGLPPTGPLKIDDVKKAFRLSALKWHPDKHQGPSQAKAEEKFKVCVNAYKSLCNALSLD